MAGLDAAAKAVFEKCREGDSPLYCEETGWPEDANEKDVLSWFAQLTEDLAAFVEKHQQDPKARRRPLAQPDQPLQGSTADRKLDVGFVDNPKAMKDLKCHWSQIL